MTSKTEAPRKKLPRACLVIYALTAVSLLLYFCFTKSIGFSDWFNQHVSHHLRKLLALLGAWIPFSLAELLILCVPLLFVLILVIGSRRFCDSNRSALVYIGILFSSICVIGILFVWNFAAGYYGSRLDEKLELERQKSSADDLYQTAELIRTEMNKLSQEIVFLEDGTSLMPYSYNEMNDKLIEAYDSFCQSHDFMKTFYSRVKPVMLSEPMSYTHITGVYTFFTGEANINVNFPDYTVVYTAAHELAHQRGVARENEANFVAFLVCSRSEDDYVRYCAYLNMYEYVASALASADPSLYSSAYSTLPTSVRAELDAYSRFYEKYRNSAASEVSGAVNNAVLIINGTEGTKSYGMVVDLAVAYYKNDR